MVAASVRFSLRSRVSLQRFGGVAATLPRASSARAAELFAAGVDEVLHAGMGSREQLARLAAALGRAAPEGLVAEAGPLRVDRGRGEATWHGRRLPLTARERDV